MKKGLALFVRGRIVVLRRVVEGRVWKTEVPVLSPVPLVFKNAPEQQTITEIWDACPLSFS